jgi:membrane dipeptidase
MVIVDAHLDLAYNVTRGRDPRMPAEQQPIAENEIATVGLPDLRGGGVGLVCATIFAEPESQRKAGYRTPEQAERAATEQWRWYQSAAAEGHVCIITDKRDAFFSNPAANRQLPCILLMEGADPILAPKDAETWFQRGIRIVGMAWKQTRYAGGTGAPGGLSAAGRELARELDRLGVIHDASHLAEAAFWDLLELSSGPVIASHSNCRAIVPTDRQLSDEMICAIASRGGVIGINFFYKFLLPPDEIGTRRATLADVVRHVSHICELTGTTRHVGLGTDMDGGLGRNEIPEEIRTSADLPRLAEALSESGFSDSDIQAIMGRNWINYFASHLPGGAA